MKMEPQTAEMEQPMVAKKAKLQDKKLQEEKVKKE